MWGIWFPHLYFVYSRVNKNGEKPQIKVMSKLEQVRELEQTIAKLITAQATEYDDSDYRWYGRQINKYKKQLKTLVEEFGYPA